MKKFVLTGIALFFSLSLIWSQQIQSTGACQVVVTQAHSAVLWEQLPDPSGFAFASQNFSDFLSYSCEGVDDFIVPSGDQWTIETITAFGGGYNGFVNGSGICSVNFYMDIAGQPAPTAFQSYLGIPYTTPAGVPQNFIITLPSALTLAPGHYWMGVAMDGGLAAYGQWGRVNTSAVTNYAGWWRNPGGGFGYGTGWLTTYQMWGVYYDFAFRLEGNHSELSVPVSNWALILGAGLIVIFVVARTFITRKS